MKISNSKKELARIVSENGGWRDGAKSAAQCKSDNAVSFYRDIPDRDGDCWWGEHLDGCDIVQDRLIANWHQSCLSRAEYLHLYPAPDADGWIEWKGGECPVGIDEIVDVRQLDGRTYTARAVNFHWLLKSGSVSVASYRPHKPEVNPEFCESVMRSIPEPRSIDGLCSKVTSENKHQHVDAKPTIEQLAADYRNLLDFARRKQQEADDAKADVGAKLKALKLAGKEHGLLVSPITAKQDPEPELVIKVQVGDEVECIKSNVTPDNFRGMVGTVLKIDCSSTPYLVDFGRYIKIWCYEVKFIRRP